MTFAKTISVEEVISLKEDKMQMDKIVYEIFGSSCWMFKKSRTAIPKQLLVDRN